MTQLANADFIDAQLRETILGKLPEAARQSLAACARVIRFKMPTLLSAAGDAPSHLYLVVQGCIELVARRASGDEFVISRIAPGGWATWLNCFMDIGADYDLYSGPSTELIAIPVEKLRTFCTEYPEAYPLIIKAIGRRMRLLLEWEAQSVTAKPAQRLAKLLHVMALEQWPNAKQATVHLTQARLASMSGCSRQTANQLIAELQAEGLILAAYGRYVIPDLKQLGAYAAQ